MNSSPRAPLEYVLVPSLGEEGFNVSYSHPARKTLMKNANQKKTSFLEKGNFQIIS